MNQVVPNFFIIGAIKSGTTTLTNYLIRHPEVFMPGTWEFNYLSSDIKRISSKGLNSDIEYLAHFSSASGRKRIGEKSVYYLFSSVAAKRIYQLNPKAKIICILRDPVSLLWSLYKYNIVNFEEDILDFDEALAAEEERKAGNRIPETATIQQNLYYREHIQYDVKIRPYLELFPQEQVKIYLFDELKNNPGGLYCDLLQFLDLSYFPIPQDKVYNEGSKVELREQRLFLHRNPRLKDIWNALPSSVRLGLKKILSTVSGGEPDQLSQIPTDTESVLRKEVRPMLLRLSRLIDRDLSVWYGKNN